MNWQRSLVFEDWEVDGGDYRVWVGFGIRPDAWKARVTLYPDGGHYFVAQHGSCATCEEAKLWCEGALITLRALVEELI